MGHGWESQIRRGFKDATQYVFNPQDWEWLGSSPL
jgi:hypothetical protein